MVKRTKEEDMKNKISKVTLEYENGDKKEVDVEEVLVFMLSENGVSAFSSCSKGFLLATEEMIDEIITDTMGEGLSFEDAVEQSFKSGECKDCSMKDECERIKNLLKAKTNIQKILDEIFNIKDQEFVEHMLDKISNIVPVKVLKYDAMDEPVADNNRLN